MARKIIVSSSDYETRAAILDDDLPVEFFLENRESEKIAGCIFKGRVSKVIPGTQSAFVDIGQNKDAFLALGGVESSSDDDDLKDIYRSPIQQMLKPGQEVILQVLKEPTPTKGPRSTMTISFPGRYLVFTPTVNHIGVSRRVAQDKEKDRLRSIGRKLAPAGTGLIFRTASEGVDEEELKADFSILLNLWKSVEARAKKSPAKRLIHRDTSLPLKIVRDYFNDEVDLMIIDSEDEYKSILEFCDFLSPLQRASLELYNEPEPLFDKFNLNRELENALERKLWLSSGGYIFFDRTEAMICIDINSGRFSGGCDLEETVFKVNLEAARIIARQIRLRNLAGMIIIDFIDMSLPKHKAEVLKVLREGFRGDRNKPHILDFSELGLVQMTRRRTGFSLDDLLKSPCDCCGGRGILLSRFTMINRVRRHVLQLIKQFECSEILVKAHPKTIVFFREGDQTPLKELEQRTGKKIALFEDDSFDIESFKVEPVLNKQDQKNEEDPCQRL